MKRLFFFPLVFILFTVVDSLASPIRDLPWHKGYVVLFTGDTLACELQFTRKVAEGLLQMRNGTRVSMLTVKDVAFFSYFDEDNENHRKFYTMTLRPELSGKTHEVFVEFLYGNDKIWILNHRALGYSKRFQLSPFRKKSIVNKLYLLDHETGHILPLSKENALVLMGNKRQEVIQFIQARGLRLRSIREFKSVLDFHQSLF